MENNINLAVFNEGGNPYRDLLETFLRLPVSGADDIFALFASLPGAIVCEGEKPMERFVYIPGTRKDRILLTAHADTVWDERYGVEPLEPADPKFVMGIYFTSNTRHGVGADDRVGCAMLWGLRNCGHSLLITDGEERGKIGARYLRKHHKKLFREINRTHRMILALDCPGSNCYLLDQVDAPEAFRVYVEEKLQIVPCTMRGGSDLEVLCERICGVNLGVGYVNPHSGAEMFFVRGWNELYRKLYTFLEEEHPRFPISKKVRFRRRLARKLPLLARGYRKLKRDGFKATAASALRRVKRKLTRNR